MSAYSVINIKFDRIIVSYNLLVGIDIYVWIGSARGLINLKL